MRLYEHKCLNCGEVERVNFKGVDVDCMGISYTCTKCNSTSDLSLNGCIDEVYNALESNNLNEQIEAIEKQLNRTLNNQEKLFFKELVERIKYIL